jgi:predicted nucleotidyltransferase
MRETWIELCLYPEIKFQIIKHFVKNPELRQNQTEIAKSIRSTQISVSRNISDLVSLNVLNEESYGRSIVYSLNSNSILVNNLLRRLVEENQTLASKWIRNQIEQLPKNIRSNIVKVMLFGSVARGSQRPTSDIDLVAVLTKPIKDFELELETHLVASGAAIGLKINLQIETKASFEKATGKKYLKAAIDEGIILWGPVK